MSILIDKNTKVLTQGMTGKTGTFHTEQGIAYGTQFVGGITPGNAPQLIRAGIDAVAVISAVFAAPDIEAAAREFQSLFELH